MIYAIIALSIYCIYLHLSKDLLPLNYYDNSRKVNELYKAHMKPLCEEYSQLKGEPLEQFDNYVRFGIFSQELIYYSELPAKLDQLKKDMKRGCKIYCKETNENT